VARAAQAAPQAGHDRGAATGGGSAVPATVRIHRARQQAHRRDRPRERAQGQSAGFRQYRAPDVKLRRKLSRRIQRLQNSTIEVGPGQKVPKAARRLRT
jgi:hypothetical protein